MPKRIEMIVLKTKDTNLRWNFLCTFPYSSSALLDPTTKARVSFFCPQISLIFSSSLEKSLNLVAPSASTIRTYFPFDTQTPALTAPPFPLFLGYQTTTKFMFNFFAVSNATSVVLSLDPSLMTMISCKYFLLFKYYAVSSSITGNLASSLQLGTTRERYDYYCFALNSERECLLESEVMIVRRSDSQFRRVDFQPRQGRMSQMTPRMTATMESCRMSSNIDDVLILYQIPVEQ